MRSYLVFFVTGPVDDELAGALRDRLRARARAWAWAATPPGWFDDPAAASAGVRTTGAYLRVEGEPDRDDVAAMWDWVITASAELMVTMEVQWQEVPLGRVVSGRPDDGLEAAVLGLV